MRGYAGYELTRIGNHWLLVEEIDGSVLDLPAGNPLHTQKTNESETPLSEQEKVTVSHRMHPETKERLSIAASKYDVNEGVLLGYVIREYYETDGWGYSLEALEALADGAAPAEPEQSDPTSRREAQDIICDQLDNGTGGDLLAEDIREVITDVAGPTVVDGKNGHLSDVLDRLGYVHHPETDQVYITEERRSEMGIRPEDPAIDRKPCSVLNKSERVEGIRVHLSRTGRGMTVSQIHAELFCGNGSKSYMRNLVHEVAESDGFTYRTTVGGSKKILRATDPNPEPDPPHTQKTESEPEGNADDREQEQAQERCEEVESDASAQMDALVNAEPATDGGIDGC